MHGLVPPPLRLLVTRVHGRGAERRALEHCLQSRRRGQTVRRPQRTRLAHLQTTVRVAETGRRRLVAAPGRPTSAQAGQVAQQTFQKATGRTLRSAARRWWRPHALVIGRGGRLAKLERRRWGSE